MSERTLILPPLHRTPDEAALFARVVHRNQFDQAGRPYVEHLQRVYARVWTWMDLRLPGEDTPRSEMDANYHIFQARYETAQIAWLHDTIEDTGTTADDLRAEGFSARVAAAVLALTKPPNRIPYREWIGCIAGSADVAVILVKLADVEDNSDPARLALLPPETRARLERKYAGAADLLRDAARRRGWQGVNP